jgi:NAD(P)-dependent dehydrogenase (short-subunit alcohol dehydrogenase family)
MSRDRNVDVGSGAVQARPVAFVTGASYGVGAATARAFARVGYEVIVTARKRENLDATLAALAREGRDATPVEMLLTDDASIEAAFRSALLVHGRIDVLVNNAAVNLRRLAIDVSRDEWREVMAANVTGPFFLTQLMGQHLISSGRQGSVVNVASTHGLVGAAERSTYGISKGALIQMTRMLAIEWAEHGIRVNAVAPGRMETASPSRAGTGSNPGYMAAMLARIPLHRLVTAEEVAEAIVYLGGPAAAAITGQVLVMDGGLTAA